MSRKTKFMPYCEIDNPEMVYLFRKYFEIRSGFRMENGFEIDDGFEKNWMELKGKLNEYLEKHGGLRTRL